MKWKRFLAGLLSFCLIVQSCIFAQAGQTSQAETQLISGEVTDTDAFRDFYEGSTDYGIAVMSSNMSISDNGVELIKSFEGYRAQAYLNPGEQYYTIGYGHCGPDVYKGMVITEEQARNFLKNDMVKHSEPVNKFLNKYGITVNQNQFDALVSFTYNLGPSIWDGSFTLKSYLINGVENYTREQITQAFANWNKDGNMQYSQGLENRRRKEAALFLGDSPSSDPGLVENSMFSTPLISYTISTGNVPTYSSVSASSSSGYITGSTDQCTINKVYTNGWVKVTYPVSSGTKTAYAKLSDFVNSGVDHYQVKVKANTSVYRRSDLSQTIGTVYSTDVINVVGKSGSNLQIIYPISGGYKMGWISQNVIEQPKKNYNVSLHVWVSEEKMGQTSKGYKPKVTQYLCYELLDNDTGQILADNIGLSYNVNEKVTKKDGTLVYSYDYKNNNNWIGVTGEGGSQYVGTVTVTGDINVSATVNWSVIRPGIDIWISDTPMGNKVTEFTEGDTAYFCYRMVDNVSGKNLNELVNYNYTATQQLYNGSNTLLKQQSFSSNEGYMSVTLNTAGSYKNTLVLSGDFGFSNDLTLTVKKKEQPQLPQLTVKGSANVATVQIGKKVVIQAQAGGGSGNYTYSYLIHNKDTNSWYRFNSSFISNNTYTWTAGSAGNREFYVEVKDTTGKVVRSESVNVKVTNPELKITGKSNISTSVIGEKVILTGTASGGSGKYSYSYLVYNKDTNSWYRFNSSFTSSNTYTWTAGSAGNREFYVEVKDSTGKVVRSSAINVKTEKKRAELSIVAGTSVFEGSVGTSFQIFAVANGGSGNYSYSYLVHNKSTNQWSRLTSKFINSNTYTWRAGSKGDREFFVEVKDSTGKVVRSKAVNIVIY